MCVTELEILQTCFLVSLTSSAQTALWLFSLISHELFCPSGCNLVEKLLLLSRDCVGDRREWQDSLCWVMLAQVPVSPFSLWTGAAAAANKPLGRGNQQLLNF